MTNTYRPNRSGYVNISLKADTVEQIKAFQIVAITKTQEMFTLSESINFAIELAVAALNPTNED